MNTPRTDALLAAWDLTPEPKALIKHAYELERELNAAKERIKKMEGVIEMAWALIANVSGGDWTRQHLEWRKAVARWRSGDFHQIMSEISARRANKTEA